MPLRVWGPAWDEEELTDGTIVGYADIAADLIKSLYSNSVIGLVSTMTVVTDGIPADYFTAGISRFVSDPLKDTIKSFGVRSEFIPVKIQVGATPYDRVPFYLANILDTAECLDEVNGEYEYRTGGDMEGEVDDIVKLAIDESKAKGHDLFWIARVSLILCVSQELQSAIRSKGFTGIGFRDPCKFRILNEMM